MILGGLIGLERASRHRSAGIRTHTLVCLGSMAIMLISEKMFLKYYSEYGIVTDPGRLTAQVVSGIGFICGGTIIYTGKNIKGITSAATLWVVGAIGIAVGCGFYDVAIILTITIYATLMILYNVTKKINERGNIKSLEILLLNKAKTIGQINLILAENNVDIRKMNLEKQQDESDSDELQKEIIELFLIIKLNDMDSYGKIYEDIKALENVLEVKMF